VALRVSGVLQLGLRGDDSRGQLSLRVLRGALGLRLSVAVASAVAAGPYLALEWNASPDEGAQ
jgi:hypothetical protein